MQQKQVLQEREKKLKEIERNEFKKLNEKLNEEEELGEYKSRINNTKNVLISLTIQYVNYLERQ